MISRGALPNSGVGWGTVCGLSYSVNRFTCEFLLERPSQSHPEIRFYYSLGTLQPSAADTEVHYPPVFSSSRY